MGQRVSGATPTADKGCEVPVCTGTTGTLALRLTPPLANPGGQGCEVPVFTGTTDPLVLRLTPHRRTRRQGCEVPACAGTTGANRPYAKPYGA